MNIKQLVDKLIEAKKAYYNDVPVISDDEFDYLELQLRELDPENEYFNMVGIETYGTKVKHIVPMKSIQKVNSFEKLHDWVNKKTMSEDTFTITPKYDGLSFKAVYEKGNLTCLATRGDGIEGQDITHIAKYIKDLNLKKEVTESFEIRGELILDKKYQDLFEGKPLRNIVGGLVGRKENLTDCKYISAIAYDIIGIDFENDADKFNFLYSVYKNTSIYILVSGNILDSYIETWIEKRNSFQYEIDGLVISLSYHKDRIKNIGTQDHHWDYNIAYKFPAVMKETTLLNISKDVSRHGNIIPIANFEPIMIMNREIKQATLSNYQTVVNMKMEIGDKLLVSLANDVIPYIEENVTKGIKQRNLIKDENFLLTTITEICPKVCPVCGTKLVISGVHFRCLNENCSEQKIKKLTYWCKETGMENLSEATIRSLFSIGYISTPDSLYRLNSHLLKDLSGFGIKRVDIILSEIAKTKKLSIDVFISALGIELVGKKAVKKLGIKTINDFILFKDDTLVIGQKIMEFNSSASNRQLIQDLLDHIQIIDPKIKTGKNIAMTGTGPKGRKELIIDIENKGDSFSESITKDTDILLCEDPNSGSSKLQKASKLGIKIISYKEYFN